MSDDYLTLVFQQPISSDVQRVLASGDWTAASHSHAIHERDRIDRIATDAAILNDRQAKRIEELEKHRDDLLAALEKSRAVFDSYVQLHRDKTPPDGEKAARNAFHRGVCDEAIANVKGGAA